MKGRFIPFCLKAGIRFTESDCFATRPLRCAVPLIATPLQPTAYVDSQCTDFFFVRCEEKDNDPAVYDGNPALTVFRTAGAASVCKVAQLTEKLTWTTVRA